MSSSLLPQSEPTPFPPPDMIELRALCDRFNRAWTPAFELRRERPKPKPIDPHDATDPAWGWLVKMGDSR